MSTPESSGLQEILALSELINKAVAQILQYGAVIPSLHSTEPGPFDTPEETPAEISAAIRTIDAACAQLSITVASPGHSVCNARETACLRVAVEAKIADLLLDKPEGLPVDQLSAKTGIDAKKLARVLRYLATKHVFTEVKPNVFANNRLSMRLLSTDPLSDLATFLGEECMKAATALNETLQDPNTTSSMVSAGTAFTRAHGHDFFAYTSTPEQQKRIGHFGRAMMGWGGVTGRAMLPKIYPWATLPKDTVVCDVGGGTGHISMILLQAHPHLKIVVQDLPGVIAQGQEILQADPMDPALKERIDYKPLDFFASGPVSNCDFYYVSVQSSKDRHDWPNASCQQILDNIRKSMKPSSRVLIHEFVLQHVARQPLDDAPVFKPAPEPLLPNYGVGNIRPYAQDLLMMEMHNSKERTLQEFIDIGTRSGLRFVKIWTQGDVPLLEFELDAPNSSV
ncbi:S-adenosyl-L-methionine-dependent methyltransferase [Roridomyces roridus]|uniref:S-adenosyl-L-methionine-dependent methyltransferase n=1 Tax=Roridomyces roridus TaxID=1738132 RepID=A0AAD7FRP4_9AGAR|nr:S-adenosyl-L-methionine-dependent methyltransferase [Roridomyces roridus]